MVQADIRGPHRLQHRRLILPWRRGGNAGAHHALLAEIQAHVMERLVGAVLLTFELSGAWERRRTQWGHSKERRQEAVYAPQSGPFEAHNRAGDCAQEDLGPFRIRHSALQLWSLSAVQPLRRPIPSAATRSATTTPSDQDRGWGSRFSSSRVRGRICMVRRAAAESRRTPKRDPNRA